MTHFDKFGLLEKKFGPFFKTAFYRAKRIVIRNLLFFSIKTVLFPVFPDMELNILEIWLKRLAVWPNFLLMRPEEFFEENNVFKKTLFCFSDFERKTYGQGQKLLAAFFKGILGVQKNFSGRFCFWILLVFWSEILEVCQKCFPNVHRIVFFDEKHFLEILQKSLFSIGRWQNLFGLLHKKLRQIC